MKISIASDHGGVALREKIAEDLRAKGVEVADYGCAAGVRVDYPDYAAKACADVAQKKSDFAILVCTSGVGMCMSANKIKGIRAYYAFNEDSAEFSRRHNDANVICFGQKYHTPYTAARLIDIFVKTPFEGGRHAARVEKMSRLGNA